LDGCRYKIKAGIEDWRSKSTGHAEKSKTNLILQLLKKNTQKMNNWNNTWYLAIVFYINLVIVQVLRMK
jgi:hypothetical protein